MRFRLFFQSILIRSTPTFSYSIGDNVQLIFIIVSQFIYFAYDDSNLFFLHFLKITIHIYHFWQIFNTCFSYFSNKIQIYYNLLDCIEIFLYCSFLSIFQLDKQTPSAKFYAFLLFPDFSISLTTPFFPDIMIFNENLQFTVIKLDGGTANV